MFAKTLPALAASMFMFAAPAFAAPAQTQTQTANAAPQLQQCKATCDVDAQACAPIGTKKDCAEARNLCISRCENPEAHRRAPKFGAFAFAPSIAGIGSAYDWSTQQKAEQSALNSCRKLNAADCGVVLWFRNACGAIAMTKDGAYGTGFGVRPSIAEGYAMQGCKKSSDKKCKIMKSVCTGVEMPS